MPKISEKILIVDDDPQILAMYSKQFKNVVNVATAAGAAQALELLTTEEFAVFVVDYNLPDMHGLELIKQAKLISPNTISMILTGEANLELAVTAINQGQSFKFLQKPCSPRVMATAFIDSLKEYRTVCLTLSEQKKNYKGTLVCLIELIKRSNSTLLLKRINLEQYIKAVSEHLDDNRKDEFHLATLMSALNFDALDPIISNKILEGKSLNKEEAQTASSIPQAMEALLNDIPMLKQTKNMIRYSLKQYNGIGYPHDDISEQAIPYEARIINILLEITRKEANEINFLDVLKSMHDEPNKFDTSLLSEVEEWIKLAKYKQVSAMINDLQEGDFLLDNIATNKGITLVSSGNAISATMVTKLQNHPEIDDIIQPVKVHRAK